MTQTIENRPCIYDDFRGEAIRPRRTERAQRQEIESILDRLTQQGDYWSLDIIRKAATKLADDTADSFALYSLLREVIDAKPGDWIIQRKK